MTKEDLLQRYIEFTQEKGFIPEFDEFSAQTGVQFESLTELFENADALIVFYFEMLFDEIHHQKTDVLDVSTLSFGESFSHLIFSCLDLLETNLHFSKLSFNVVESGLFSDSKIHHLLRNEFESYINQDSLLSVTAHILIGDVFYNQMIRDWEGFVKLGLEQSLESEQWIERIDKFTRLLDSILHNDLPDKGVDYLKTLYAQGVFSLKNLF